MNEAPDRFATFMSNKQYLHATHDLVKAVELGKNTLDGVESLKELSRDLEQKKEQLHLQIYNELKEHLFGKPAQSVLSLRRQESYREQNTTNSPLQRSTEIRLSRNNRNARKNLFQVAKNFQVEEDLAESNPEENSPHFIIILIKCLALLDKLSFAVTKLGDEMQNLLMGIVQRTTQHIRDFAGLQTDADFKIALKELMQTLFLQFDEVGKTFKHFLRNVEEAGKVHGGNVNAFTMQFYWTQVQCVVSFIFKKLNGLFNVLLFFSLNLF